MVLVTVSLKEMFTQSYCDFTFLASFKKKNVDKLASTIILFKVGKKNPIFNKNIQ